MKRSIAWIFLAFCSSAWAGNKDEDFEARLDKALYLFSAAAEIQNNALAINKNSAPDALVTNSRRMAAEAVASVFFQDELIFDRAQVQRLGQRLKDYLNREAEHLPRALILELIEAFYRKLNSLKSRTDYDKGAWKRSLAVSLFIPSVLQLSDWIVDKFFKTKTLNRSLQRFGAWLRVKSGCCKFAFVQLSLKGSGDALRKFPRASFYLFASPLLFGLSHSFYFRHQENWDPTEEEVRDEILPLLRELSKID